MEYALNVLSSDGDKTYTVCLDWDGEELAVSCDCRAGQVGQHCKHKDAILRGNYGLVVKEPDNRTMSELTDLIARSAVGSALHRLVEAEVAVAGAQDSLRQAKKSLERAMRRT